MTIRESIIYFQDLANISNATMCNAIETTPGNYSSFRAGRRNLTWEQLQKAIDFLELKITK